MAGSQVTTKKVFVGGISSNTKEDDIRAYFSAYGTVSVERCLLPPQFFENVNLCGVVLISYLS